MRDFAQIHLARPDESARRGVEVTLATLDRMSELCAESEVESFVLVVIPRSLQVYTAEAREMREALGVGEDELRLDAAQELLREWAAARPSVLLVDPLARFRAEAREGRTPLLHSRRASIAGGA